MTIDFDIKILLVEDSRITRKMEIKVLNELGFHHIIEAEDGEIGIRQLIDNPDISLIISDWNMPEMNGYEFLKWVRSDEQYITIPFIMATAQAEKKQVEKAKQAGVTNLITKPFAPKELLRVIEDSFNPNLKEDISILEPRKLEFTDDGKLILNIAHIQITDHLVLGVLKHMIQTGELQPSYFELNTHCMSSWNPVQQSLEERKVEGALVLAPIAMDLFEYGVPIKLILLAHKNGSICVKNARGPATDTIRLFYLNKIFYIPHILSIHHMFSDLIFTQLGLNPGLAGNENVDLFFEVIPPVKMPEFIEKNNDVSGYLVAEPLGSKAIATGSANRFFLSGELWKDHPCCVVVMQDHVIQSHPEALQEFTTMLVQAGKFIAKNLKQASEIAVNFLDPEKTLGLKAPILERVLTEENGITTHDLFPIMEDFEVIQHYMNEKMGVGSIIDLSKFIDTRFAEIACDQSKGSDRPTVDLEALAKNLSNKLSGDVPAPIQGSKTQVQSNQVQSIPEPVSEKPPIQSTPKPVPIQTTPQSIPKSEPEQPQPISEAPKDEIAAPRETSLRVNINLLDSLMNLAGELVLSRNQLLQAMASKSKNAVVLAGQRLDTVTSDLQEAIMLTRMQPIGRIFDRFPRVIRDLGMKLGKEIQLITEGKDVELDKSILEGLYDPLNHMLRNAVDHGIESNYDRKMMGKPEKGTIVIKAYHQAGQINIEVSDDGKGIDIDQLTQKAIQKKLITAEQAEVMKEKEKLHLIFLPGFSMAKEVSDISGRGVGMDVVKSNLDSMGGFIDVVSTVGEGTSFNIKLPLTLAIIPSLIVASNQERYAIPQVNLYELLRIPHTQIKERIEIVGDAYVVRLREALLPIILLSDILENKKTKLEKLASAVNIAVVSSSTFRFGLIVDELHDSEEIVVKPLGRHLKSSKEYAGATILGDGRVSLILDVANIAKKAELIAFDEKLSASQAAKKMDTQIDLEEESFLVFHSSPEEQFAVPLNLVSRIEKVPSKKLEKVGNHIVMQYRGVSMPLFAMHEVAKVKPIEDQSHYTVIVFEISGKEFGLLTTGPIDSTITSVNVDETVFKQTGILGSMIINDNTTLIVDIYGFIQTIRSDWISDVVEKDFKGCILLVEDSNFFRNQMKHFIEEDGYKILEAEDGKIGLNTLNEHAEEIDLIITDIQMPNMDGFAFTQAVRSHPVFKNLPIIAVTSLSEQKYRDQGKKVGINDYQSKLDREKVLASIGQFIK